MYFHLIVKYTFKDKVCSETLFDKDMNTISALIYSIKSRNGSVQINGKNINCTKINSWCVYESAATSATLLQILIDESTTSHTPGVGTAFPLPPTKVAAVQRHATDVSSRF